MVFNKSIYETYQSKDRWLKGFAIDGVAHTNVLVFRSN